MKMRFMRKVDYHVGIPLCALFSALHLFSRRVLRKDREIRNPKRILFIKLMGMGSMVLAAPALNKCREAFPDADFYFLTFEQNEKLFGLFPTPGRVTVLTISTSSIFAFLSDTVRVLLRIRREKIDVVVDLEFFSRFTSVLSFLSRARHRVGFYNHFIEGLYRGDFLTHKVFYNHYQHTALSYLDVVETMRGGETFHYNKNRHPVLPVAGTGSRFPVSEEEKKAAAEKFALEQAERLVLLNPSVSEDFIELRRWPVQHFAEVARKLLRESPSVSIGIIGGPGDVQVASELERRISDPRVINFAGRTSLRELLLLLDSSCCLITNDSGPAHLASLTGARIITLFGPETPLLYGPLSQRATDLFLGLGCSPCVSVYNGKRTACRDNVCLQQITPDMVFDEVMKEW